ncbi:MAG TPA: hypothetical protein VM241_04245 [Candidatus Thermoplasmatota archaeon]|nr:hypothetical protein [Candidatus Thermoplasmatota archaeon]
MTRTLLAALAPLTLAVALAGIAHPIAAIPSNAGNITIHDWGFGPVVLFAQGPLGWTCDHKAGDILAEPISGGVAVTCGNPDSGEACTQVAVAGYGASAGVLRATSACSGLSTSLTLVLPSAGGSTSSSGRGHQPWTCAVDDTLVSETGEDWWIHCTMTLEPQ